MYYVYHQMYWNKKCRKLSLKCLSGDTKTKVEIRINELRKLWTVLQRRTIKSLGYCMLQHIYSSQAFSMFPDDLP